MTGQLNLEQFKASLPQRVRKNITQDVLDSVNKVFSDPVLGEEFKNNIVDYASVLKDGKYKISDYCNAVRYVTAKLLGATNFSAYCNVFPDRYQHMLDKGVEPKYIDSVVSVYNKRQLVQKIFEQSIIPTHIFNQGLHQKAVNHLAFLMLNATSEKVQSDSASKLLDALKVPETQKIELDITTSEDDSIKELRQSTLALVAQQKLIIESGAMTPKEIAHSKLHVVEGEAKIVDDTA